MIPFVAAGGILIAISYMFGIDASGVEGSLPYYLNAIGQKAFSVMIPIMSGFIAYSMADRPGIAPGLTAGLIATFIVGMLMYLVVAPPCVWIQTAMTNWLTNMSDGSGILLGAVIGAMLAFDLGGPVNKVAYMFGVGLMAEGIYGPQAASMASGMVPSLAMALATVLKPSLYTPAERESGKSAWLLGRFLYRRGSDPLRRCGPAPRHPFPDGRRRGGRRHGDGLSPDLTGAPRRNLRAGTGK